MYQQFETMEDYHEDGEIALSNIQKHIKSTKDKGMSDALLRLANIDLLPMDILMKSEPMRAQGF